MQFGNPAIYLKYSETALDIIYNITVIVNEKNKYYIRKSVFIHKFVIRNNV